MKMIDVILNIDSLMMEDDETIDDVIAHLREKYEFGYSPTCEVLYEEYFDD